jgi:hypothetical protein
MGRMRNGFLAVGIAGLTALGASGCGGDDGGSAGDTTSTPAAQAPAATQTQPAATTPSTTATEPAAVVPASDPVAKAAALAAQLKGGVKVTLKGKVVAGGRASELMGKGTVDRTTGRGAFDLTTVGAFTMHEVMDGRTVYLTNKLFTNRLPGKRSWMRIDLAKAAKIEGFNMASLGTNGPSQNPTQVLNYLHGAGPAKKLGTATIRGTKTTHYSVVADLAKAKAAASSKAGKDAIGQLVETLGDRGATIPVEVWVDGRHRILRERVRYTATLNNAKNVLDFTTDFADVSGPVKVPVPPASDTVDGLKLIAQGGSGTQSSS